MLQQGQRERKRRTKVAALKSHDPLVRLRDNQHADYAQEFFWPKHVDEMDEKPARLWIQKAKVRDEKRTSCGGDAEYGSLHP